MSASPAGAERPAPFPSVQVMIREPGDLGEARRVAVSLAERCGFDASRRHELGIVASELATNAVRHGGGGQLIARALPGPDGTGVELLVLDRGPGMANVTDSMRDGHSTAGSMGTGLGAALRLADGFDLFSMPGQGTAVVARCWAERRPAPSMVGARSDAAEDRAQAATGAVCVPMAGETECGDGWCLLTRGSRTLLLVVDGLGHGPAAAAAARTAVDAFVRSSDLPPVSLMSAVHDALRSTRGAAAAVAELDTERRELSYVGVGNIAGAILSGATARHLVSHNGTVGHLAPRMQVFVYPWPLGSMLIMNSDGLTSQWRLEPYRGLAHRDPAVVAGVLARDFARGRDDLTVIVHVDPPATA